MNGRLCFDGRNLHIRCQDGCRSYEVVIVIVVEWWEEIGIVPVQLQAGVVGHTACLG